MGDNNDASGLGKMTAAFLDEVGLRELRIKLILGLWSGLKKKPNTDRVIPPTAFDKDHKSCCHTTHFMNVFFPLTIARLNG